ncbi:MAG: RecX family transcriptional regulator [Rhodospirillales bacterium]|nr:RecX family transcriptional regulator [Rhodospirillales bacterium]
MNDQPTITAIVPSKRSPDLASIRVAGKTVATMSTQRIAELGVAVGQPWTIELAEQVEQAGAYDKAMRTAMNTLNRRPLSRRELDRKLREKEHDEAVRQHVLDRLEELGLLDDEAFGRALLREMQRGKPAGPRLMQQKLFTKGLDRKLIDKLVTETSTNTGSQTEQATALARKRATAMASLDARTRYRRLYGLLARRGFEPDVIRSALEAVVEESE